MKEEFFVNQLLEFAQENLREYPWRDENDPYKVLIAEIMLRRTNADQVLPIYEEFIDKFPTINALKEPSDSELKEVLEPLGLVNRRLAMIKEVLDASERKFGGTIPTSPNLLISIKGIGPYISNITACLIDNRKVPAVDSNVNRLISRFFGINPNNEKDIKTKVESLLPDNDKDVIVFNLALIDLPAAYCKPNPICNECPLTKWCSHCTLH